MDFQLIIDEALPKLEQGADETDAKYSMRRQVILRQMLEKMSRETARDIQRQIQKVYGV